MNLVSFALRRPISLLMAIAATVLVGLLAIDRMARDIFPDLGVPVLYVAQPYGGFGPARIEGVLGRYLQKPFLFFSRLSQPQSNYIQLVALIIPQIHPLHT